MTGAPSSGSEDGRHRELGEKREALIALCRRFGVDWCVVRKQLPPLIDTLVPLVPPSEEQVFSRLRRCDFSF
jgi:hypothetical protein